MVTPPLSEVTMHCFQHLLHSLWRKKPIVLAVIMVSTLVVVAMQYSSVNRAQDKMDERGHQSSLPRRNLSALRGQLQHKSVLDAEEAYARNRVDKESFVLDNVAPHQGPSSREEVGGGDGGDGEHLDVIGGADDNEAHRLGLHNRPALRVDSRANMVHAKKPDYVPPIRLVHIDLKGAPPKISYLKHIFPLLKQAGANGILLEYEDMFPFWGNLAPIAAGNAYSRSDVVAILNLAKIHEFEVIPLVQTFGHLEFALKLKEFSSLREVDIYPMAICPSKNDSFTLVKTIIDQVMLMHPTAKWLHIGCDEVFHMGYCEKCRTQNRDNIYLNQVSRVAKYVRSKYNVVPIIWDDMLRNIPTDALIESKIGSLVEPMVWTYVKDVYRFIPYSTWSAFAEVFPNIWAASAFKGAFGETLTVPNVKMHLENNEAWLEVMNEQFHNFKSMRGIAVTGWQRYDHMATLCETLPAGMPSLIINLLTLKHGRFSGPTVFKEFDTIMSCNPQPFESNEINGDSDQYLYNRAATCRFPGSPVFHMTQVLTETIKKVNDYIYDVTVHKAWMTAYNVRRNYSNPFRVEEGLQEHSSYYYSLTSVVKQAQDALKEVFGDYVVAEWIEQNIYPYLLKMEKVMQDAINLKKPRIWKKRPLPRLDDLKRFGVGDEL